MAIIFPMYTDLYGIMLRYKNSLPQGVYRFNFDTLNAFADQVRLWLVPGPKAQEKLLR